MGAGWRFATGAPGLVSSTPTEAATVSSPTTPGQRPSWSPSGEEIAAAILADGTRTLMAIRADGSGSRVLVPHNRVASFEDFAWSSTGKIAMRRYYQSGHPDSGKQALVTMNDGGGNETVIFRPVHQAPGPESLSWSPDGTQIAFHLDEIWTTVDRDTHQRAQRRRFEPSHPGDRERPRVVAGRNEDRLHDRRDSIHGARHRDERGRLRDQGPRAKGMEPRLAALSSRGDLPLRGAAGALPSAAGGRPPARPGPRPDPERELLGWTHPPSSLEARRSRDQPERETGFG